LPPARLPTERHGSSGRHDPGAYDDAARRIIGERCGAEIERFGYCFENAFSADAALPAGGCGLRADWNANFAVRPFFGGGSKFAIPSVIDRR
jgi:hypothetical protein